MPTPRHIIVRPLGQSPNGETWTFGLRYSNNPAGAHDLDAGQLQDIADAVAALYSGKGLPPQIYAMLSSSLSLAGIRVEQIGTDGKLERAAESLYAPPKTGGDPPTKPVQIALVFSLNRGAQYGRSGRGRVYVPACGGFPTMGADFRVQGNQMTDVLGYFNQLQADWGSAINAQVGAYVYELVVYSKLHDTLTPVDNLGLGDVFDTQRRRRDKWVEARVTATRL